MANIVAIVGRPNVGKSTLFNKLIGERRSIMDNESGVTRDRHYGICEWNGKKFTVIDTGGYVVGGNDIFEKEIREQVELAVEEADVILFVVDCQTGLTGFDEEFAKLLRRSKKPVLVTANKADIPSQNVMATEFYSLGMGEVYPISGDNGAGTGDLLDEVAKLLPENATIEDDNTPKIAIIGKPNVGKSSFTNLLLGYKRSIVTDIAGTTRDAVYAKYNAFGFEFNLIDTAGMRKKAKVNEDLEFYSVLRTVQAVENSDICVVMMDATLGIEAQDMSIIALAMRYNKGVMILVNKWDLYEKDSNTAQKYEELIRNKLKPMDHIPVLFVSVLEKQRIVKAIEMMVELYKERTKKIPTSELNKVMLEEIERYPPPSIKGKDIQIKFINQLKHPYPLFAFYCNLPQYIQENYERYLENRIRQHFGFAGIPIKIVFRKK